MSSVVASGIMPVGESLANGTDRVWLRRTGVEKTPRRPRIIMEGPLVSDTTEVLSGAAPAPEESPIGHPAADPAGTASRSVSRGGGGDLSKLLVPDLQRIAQELGISGTGRMRKGDLVAAIQERTGGGRPAPRSSSPAPRSASSTQRTARTGGRTSRTADQSATRGTSAGADAPRPLNQDAMEAAQSVRSGTGEAPLAVVRSAGREAEPEPTVTSVAAQASHTDQAHTDQAHSAAETAA